MMYYFDFENLYEEDIALLNELIYYNSVLNEALLPSVVYDLKDKLQQLHPSSEDRKNPNKFIAKVKSFAMLLANKITANPDDSFLLQIVKTFLSGMMVIVAGTLFGAGLMTVLGSGTIAAAVGSMAGLITTTGGLAILEKSRAKKSLTFYNSKYNYCLKKVQKAKSDKEKQYWMKFANAYKTVAERAKSALENDSTKNESFDYYDDDDVINDYDFEY